MYTNILFLTFFFKFFFFFFRLISAGDRSHRTPKQQITKEPECHLATRPLPSFSFLFFLFLHIISITSFIYFPMTLMESWHFKPILSFLWSVPFTSMRVSQLVRSTHCMRFFFTPYRKTIILLINLVTENFYNPSQYLRQHFDWCHFNTW